MGYRSVIAEFPIDPTEAFRELGVYLYRLSGSEITLGGNLNAAMIIAVIPVRMVQVAVHQVIGVIAVRHGFMAAAGAVLVGGVVGAARVLRRAG